MDLTLQPWRLAIAVEPLEQLMLTLELLSPLRPLPPPWPSIPSTALCILFDPLSSLGSSVLSKVLRPFLQPCAPVRPSLPSPALSPLCGPLSPLQPSLPSTALSPPTALCPLYSHMYPLSFLQPFVPSTAFCLAKALCPLYDSQSHLQPSVPSTALCLLYGPSYSLYSLYPLCPLLLFRWWLPKAHIEASLLGSIFLTGIIPRSWAGTPQRNRVKRGKTKFKINPYKVCWSGEIVPGSGDSN
jgi:hypothetical protein